jgi:poly(3-hydroxybutyrate) depolymerase
MSLSSNSNSACFTVPNIVFLRVGRSSVFFLSMYLNAFFLFRFAKHAPIFKMAPAKLASLFLFATTLVSTCNAAPSGGCGKNLPAAQTPPGGPAHQTDFTQSDGTARTYRIHIPSNYDKNKPVPLIFSFHGHGKTSGEQEDLSQFSNEEFNPNAIAVYPQGLKVRISSNNKIA